MRKFDAVVSIRVPNGIPALIELTETNQEELRILLEDYLCQKIQRGQFRLPVVPEGKSEYLDTPEPNLRYLQAYVNEAYHHRQLIAATAKSYLLQKKSKVEAPEEEKIEEEEIKKPFEIDKKTLRKILFTRIPEEEIKSLYGDLLKIERLPECEIERDDLRESIIHHVAIYYPNCERTYAESILLRNEDVVHGVIIQKAKDLGIVEIIA